MHVLTEVYRRDDSHTSILKQSTSNNCLLLNHIMLGVSIITIKVRCSQLADNQGDD